MPNSQNTAELMGPRLTVEGAAFEVDGDDKDDDDDVAEVEVIGDCVASSKGTHVPEILKAQLRTEAWSGYTHVDLVIYSVAAPIVVLGE